MFKVLNMSCFIEKALHHINGIPALGKVLKKIVYHRWLQDSKYSSRSEHATVAGRTPTQLFHLRQPR